MSVVGSRVMGGLSSAGGTTLPYPATPTSGGTTTTQRHSSLRGFRIRHKRGLSRLAVAAYWSGDGPFAGERGRAADAHDLLWQRATGAAANRVTRGR